MKKIISSFARLAIGCIEADFWKYKLMLQHSSSLTKIGTLLHRSKNVQNMFLFSLLFSFLWKRGACSPKCQQMLVKFAKFTRCGRLFAKFRPFPIRWWVIFSQFYLLVDSNCIFSANSILPYMVVLWSSQNPSWTPWEVCGPCFVVFELSDSCDRCLAAFGHSECSRLPWSGERGLRLGLGG